MDPYCVERTSQHERSLESMLLGFPADRIARDFAGFKGHGGTRRNEGGDCKAR